jgi:TolB-like protein
MPDIFLSYTREDQATAQRFAEAFAAQGFSVWWDATLRSGEAYDQVTEEALRTAKAVVVLWSKKSVVSRWVRAEATLADRNRTLAPARIEACDLPIMFELTQTADLSRWMGEAQDPAWRAFLADVRRFVEAGAAPPPPAPRPLTQEDAPAPQSMRASLAVLPFVNRSGLAEDDVFADGLVEDLTAALSGSRWIQVVAASATAVYRNGARDLRRIGRDLGARYLLEGNVRRISEVLRVTAQLVVAESGGILWTQKFDRPRAEIAALEEELVAELAAHLRMQVERAEMEHALKKPGNGSAWEALLRSTAHAAYATRAVTEASVADAKRAVDLDPNNGVACAWLASYQGHLLHLGGGDDPELAQEIARNIARARALDPNNPEVLAGVAVALSWLRKVQEALPLAERAVSINPNEGMPLVLGSVLVRVGRSEEAIAQLDAVVRLSPNSTFAHLATRWRSIAYLQAGRIGEALAAADQALRVLPNGETLIQSMLCLAKSDDWDRARAALRHLRDMDPDISRAQIEHIVRDFYCGSQAADDYIAIVRTLWDETSSEAQSP